MMLVAGLLGMVAVGASAFVGLGGGSDDTPDPGTAPDDGPQDSGTDLLDALAQDPDEAAQPVWQVIAGQDEAEVIAGTDGQDQINGYQGDDTITGGAGADVLHGGAGQDLVQGEGGDDTLHGGDGADDLRGGRGEDRLFGHNDDDRLFGGAGDDSLVGSAGDDTLVGGQGADALHGDIGNDHLTGDLGQDTLFGGIGDDTLSGVVDDPDTAARDDLDERDYLNGGSGDDVILAGQEDVVSTGAGADQVILGDWLTAGHQAEILDFSVAEDTLLVVYDDAAGEVPEIGLVSDPETPEAQHLVVNGVQLATIANAAGLTLDHVTLLPQSGLAGLVGS
jgi:Ca2+-binding RTX toxin-like protein